MRTVALTLTKEPGPVVNTVNKRVAQMKILAVLPVIIAGISFSGPACAAETITYSYDANGRLVKVERAGTVNDNVIVEYTYDKADNRTRVKTTGSPN